MKKDWIVKLSAFAGVIGLSLSCIGCGSVTGDTGNGNSGNGHNGNGSSSASGNVQNNSGSGTGQNNGEACELQNVNIGTMTIAFYEHYNRATAEAINANTDIKLPEYVITLDAEQIAAIQATVPAIEEYVDDGSDLCNCAVALFDKYEICINDEIVLNCDPNGFIWETDPWTVYTADAFAEAVNNIATEYLAENIYFNPFEEGVDFIIHDGDSIEVTDDLMERLGEYSFSRVECATDYNSFDQIENVITLSNGGVLLTYAEYDSYAYLDGANYGYYVVICEPSPTTLNEYLENVYNNRTNGFGVIDDTAEITVCAGDVCVVADNELADMIRSQSKEMEYNHFDWLNENYEIEESVVIVTDNGSYYIPIDRTYGNRYYVTENGEKYFIAGFSSEVTSRVFELVGIER